jgi:hypothetical protein
VLALRANCWSIHAPAFFAATIWSISSGVGPKLACLARREASADEITTGGGGAVGVVPPPL